MRRILWTDGRTAVFCVNEIIRWFQKLKSCAFFPFGGGVIYILTLGIRGQMLERSWMKRNEAKPPSSKKKKLKRRATESPNVFHSLKLHLKVETDFRSQHRPKALKQTAGRARHFNRANSGMKLYASARWAPTIRYKRSYMYITYIAPINGWHFQFVFDFGGVSFPPIFVVYGYP